MRRFLTTSLLLFGLLLQAAAWVVPAQRAVESERLTHELAHAVDHGHHVHEAFSGHDLDPALNGDDRAESGDHGPHHSHAAEGGHAQVLASPAVLSVLHLPRGAPDDTHRIEPASVVLSGPLRPPQARV